MQDAQDTCPNCGLNFWNIGHDLAATPFRCINAPANYPLDKISHLPDADRMSKIRMDCPQCGGQFQSYGSDELPAKCTYCSNPGRPIYLVKAPGVQATPESPETGGIKHDQEKNQLELLSPIWLVGVGRVLTFGAKKYAAHNWRKGIARSRLLGAALRHLLAYMGGEDLDPETGVSHLHHASCCLMFASELHETRPDTDDRYKHKISPPAIPAVVTAKGIAPV